MLAALLALTVPAAALPPPPPAPTLTAAEEARLAKGDVVVRYGGDASQTLAVVDIAASPDKVMAAVMDLPARVDDIGALSAVELYNRKGDDVSAKWTMSIAMVSVVFHIEYDCELSAKWCMYTLDDDKDNDLSSSNGSYHAVPHGSGSRLIYRTDSVAAGAPEWVRKKLADSSASEMLGGMKTRAER